jgi:site-specific recombinase XerD
LAKPTIRSYGDTSKRFVEQFGSQSVCQATRPDIHKYLGNLLNRGLTANSVRLQTAGLRCFFKFLRFASLVDKDPMFQVAHRKVPKRLPRVLTIEEVERVIAAGRNPVECAIAEVLYATGVRVSELCGIKLENMILPEHMILIERGKGGKDRWVLYGRHAALAIAKAQEWRPSQAGYLFESPARNGSIYIRGKRWNASFYAKTGQQHTISIGKTSDIPNEEAARAVFEKITANMPNAIHRPRLSAPLGPYTTRAIAMMLRTLGHIAGVAGVHPHSFRRAFACHLLSSGADIRAIQELLGHKLLTTTMIYTTLTNDQVDRVYRKAHPHADNAERGTDGKED